MKHMSIRFFAFAAAVALICACGGGNAARKLDRFVDQAELKSDSYDARDWEKSIGQYQKFVEEYIASDGAYTDAERQMAARAMGRYHSLLIKHGIEASASYLEGLMSVLPSYLEGFSDGLNENMETIGSALEGLFDNEGLERALEGLGEKLDNLFGSLGE